MKLVWCSKEFGPHYFTLISSIYFWNLSLVPTWRCASSPVQGTWITIIQLLAFVTNRNDEKSKGAVGFMYDILSSKKHEWASSEKLVDALRPPLLRLCTRYGSCCLTSSFSTGTLLVYTFDLSLTLALFQVHTSGEEAGCCIRSCD